MRSVALVSAVVVVCACDSGGGVPGPMHEPTFVSVALPAEPQLDVLIVMDNSPAMLVDAVADLGAALPAFFTAITGDGALPDLQIGVVTSDLSTLGVNIGDPGCATSDRGHLQNIDCPDVTGAYIADISDGMGGRMTNYDDALTLDAAVSCLMNVGTDGCGFEQHLEAMKVAIDDTDMFNTGFFRQTAQLAVLIVGDEDDCSPDDPAFFGPDTPQLGPLDSFRCFEFGVTCAEPDPRAEGAHTACAPREGSFLHGMQRYLDVLDAERPGRYAVHGIFAPAEPVMVTQRTPMGQTTPRPTLAPSCMRDGGGVAVPAVRLDAFVDLTGDFGSSTSICEPDFTGAMTAFGERVRDRMRGQPCLRAEAWDADTATDGLQPECAVVLTAQDAPPAPLAACDAAVTNPPCWRLVADPACGAAPTDLRLDAVGITPMLGRHVQARCETVP
jgi:hypothetical protein